MGKLQKHGSPWGYGAARRGRNLAGAVVMAALPLTTTFTPVAAADEPVTIAALGDSLTHGYGLPPDQGFVPQLQEWLRARGLDVTVLNAGVSGDTTAGGLARLDWTLTPEVDALIVELGANDFLRGIDPAAARANLDAILTRAGDAGLPVLLIGLPAPGNYGADYKQQFDAIWPDLAAKHGTLLVTSFFRGLATPGADPAAERERVMQPDGTHPNAEGVARIVADIGPEVAALVARVTP